MTLMIPGILAALFIAFQYYTTMTSNKSETQPYKVVRKEKEFEIRFYPSATVATIISSAKSYKELGSSGFTKLAGYIFGGNKDKQRIAMTSPVRMEISDTKSSMSFVMPEKYNESNLPQPNNSDVTIHTTPEEYVAVISFGGFSSNERIAKYSALLEQVLQAHHVSYYGHFRYLGYNPPYQLLGRRNEVIVAIDGNQLDKIE